MTMNVDTFVKIDCCLGQRGSGAVGERITGGRVLKYFRSVLPLGLLVFAAGAAGNAVSGQAAYANEPYEVRTVDRSQFEARFLPTVVPAPPGPVGSIIVDTRDRLLYLIEENGRARRYGIAVGKAAHAWSGTATIERKAKWPSWHPTAEMRKRTPGLPKRIGPGPHNPMGARALYLYQDGRDTLYRIHGTSNPQSIGGRVSAGCIRMLNEDVIDLYERVKPGALVKVM